MTDILQPANSLVVYRNANTAIQLTVTNSDSSPTNLTGARLVLTVKNRSTDTGVVFLKSSDSGAGITVTSASGGTALVSLLPTDTKNLAVREYVFDVWMVLGGKQFPIIPPTILDLRAGVTVL